MTCVGRWLVDESCKQVVEPTCCCQACPVDDDAVTAIDDDIVSGRIIPAIIGIRTELGCGIPAALDEFSKRYERLREQRPDDFALSRDEYPGGEFYS